MNVALKFEKGDKVRDKISGFVGVISGFSYFYGMEKDSYLVEGIDTTGRPIREWIIAGKLVKVNPDVAEKKIAKKTRAKVVQPKAAKAKAAKAKVVKTKVAK